MPTYTHRNLMQFIFIFYFEPPIPLKRQKQVQKINYSILPLEVHCCHGIEILLLVKMALWSDVTSVQFYLTRIAFFIDSISTIIFSKFTRNVMCGVRPMSVDITSVTVHRYFTMAAALISIGMWVKKCDAHNLFLSCRTCFKKLNWKYNDAKQK